MKLAAMLVQALCFPEVALTLQRVLHLQYWHYIVPRIVKQLYTQSLAVTVSSSLTLRLFKVQTSKIYKGICFAPRSKYNKRQIAAAGLVNGD